MICFVVLFDGATLTAQSVNPLILSQKGAGDRENNLIRKNWLIPGQATRLCRNQRGSSNHLYLRIQHDQHAGTRGFWK